MAISRWWRNGRTRGPLSVSLTTVAKEASRRVKPLVLVPAVVQKDAGHARVIAVPLQVRGRLIGAAALAVRSPDPAVAKGLLDELEQLAPALAEGLVTTLSDAPVNRYLELQELVATAQDLRGAALKIANQLAREYQFDRVSVGVIDGGRMRVAAISHGAGRGRAPGSGARHRGCDGGSG